MKTKYRLRKIYAFAFRYSNAYRPNVLLSFDRKALVYGRKVREANFSTVGPITSFKIKVPEAY